MFLPTPVSPLSSLTSHVTDFSKMATISVIVLPWLSGSLYVKMAAPYRRCCEQHMFLYSFAFLFLNLGNKFNFSFTIRVNTLLDEVKNSQNLQKQTP